MKIVEIIAQSGAYKIRIYTGTAKAKKETLDSRGLPRVSTLKTGICVVLSFSTYGGAAAVVQNAYDRGAGRPERHGRQLLPGLYQGLKFPLQRRIRMKPFVDRESLRSRRFVVEKFYEILMRKVLLHTKDFVVQNFIEK